MAQFLPARHAVPCPSLRAGSVDPCCCRSTDIVALLAGAADLWAPLRARARSGELTERAPCPAT